MGGSTSSLAFLESLREGREPDAKLLARYAAQLFKVACKHLDSQVLRKEGPEDVVQSAFRSFFRRRQEGKLDLTGEQRLYGLLVVITRRKCSKKNRDYRREKRDVRREVPFYFAGDADLSWSSIAPTIPPDEAATLCELIEELVRGFGDRDRQIFLYALDGYTRAEIAEKTGIAERTVRRVLAKVKQRFRQIEADLDTE